MGNFCRHIVISQKLILNCGEVKMEEFFIDRLGNEGLNEISEAAINIQNNDRNNANEFLNYEEIDLFDELHGNSKSKEIKLKKDEINLENTYLISNYKSSDKDKDRISNVDKLLEKSVIGTGFEKRFSVPSEKSKKVLKWERKKLQENTKGRNWFNMPATELTEEIKTDFELLKMRSVLDSKHVYKKNDITHTPKYFQVGKVVEGPADFYSGRIPKSLRKKTMVDELLADAEFKKYQKKKFKEIMDESRRKKKTKKTLRGNKTQKKRKSER